MSSIREQVAYDALRAEFNELREEFRGLINALRSDFEAFRDGVPDWEKELKPLQMKFPAVFAEIGIDPPEVRQARQWTPTQCEGRTASGKQCKGKAMHHDTLCYNHGMRARKDQEEPKDERAATG